MIGLGGGLGGSPIDKLKGINIDREDRRWIHRVVVFVALVVAVGMWWAVYANNAGVIQSIVVNCIYVGAAALLVLIAGNAVSRAKPKAPTPAPLEGGQNDSINPAPGPSQEVPGDRRGV